MYVDDLNIVETREETSSNPCASIDIQKNIEKDLIFVGMVGMIDPPREEAKIAVEKCKTAGIKTVMITGDHLQTAKAIAKELGILKRGDLAIDGETLERMSQHELEQNIMDYSVFARVTPEHKVRRHDFAR